MMSLFTGLYGNFYSKVSPYPKLEHLNFSSKPFETKNFELVRLIGVENGNALVKTFRLSNSILIVNGISRYVGSDVSRAEPISDTLSLVLVENQLFLMEKGKRRWLANDVRLFAYDHLNRWLYIMYSDASIWVRRNLYVFNETMLFHKKNVRDMEASCKRLIIMFNDYSIELDGKNVSKADLHTKIPFLYYEKEKYHWSLNLFFIWVPAILLGAVSITVSCSISLLVIANRWWSSFTFPRP